MPRLDSDRIPAVGRLALPPCLYCAGESYRPLFAEVEDRLGHVPGRWAFLRCEGCGSAMLAPQPRAEDLGTFYPPVYGFTQKVVRPGLLPQLMAGLDRAFFALLYEGQVRAILRAAGIRSGAGQRLLDVGCGRGLRLQAFQRRGFEVQGMDFQPEVVADVQERLGIEAVCTSVDGIRASFAAESFDMVTAFYVAEHVLDVQALLQDCRALLRPGGWLVCAVPLVDGLQARLFGARWQNVTEAPRHLSLPSRAGILGRVRAAGFASVTLLPDSVVSRAGSVGLSLVPRAAVTYVYGGGGRWLAMGRRLLAGALAALAVPLVVLDDGLLRRPSLGIVLAQRPRA